MSSSGSQKLMTTISQILHISELIDHINRSNGKSHLNDPQNKLSEYNTKMEIENLTRSRDAVKREVCELDRSLDLAELSNLKLQDDLRKTQRKCDELEKTVALLMEEKNQREEKIIELENKSAESERLLKVYLEKCESLDIENVKMGKEIEGLRLKKSESDQAAEGYKNKYQMFSPRMVKIEKDLALLNANSPIRSCYSGGRSSGLSRTGMKGKGWGVQMCSGLFCKIAQSSSAAAAAAAAQDIIELSDDEELSLDGAAHVANVGENKMKIVHSSSPSQRSKRNRANVDDIIMDLTARKKRNLGARDEENEKENQVLESSEDRIACSLSSRKCVGEEEAGQASDYQWIRMTHAGTLESLLYH